MLEARRERRPKCTVEIFGTIWTTHTLLRLNITLRTASISAMHGKVCFGYQARGLTNFRVVYRKESKGRALYFNLLRGLRDNPPILR
jgi:hypothetical protein